MKCINLGCEMRCLAEGCFERLKISFELRLERVTTTFNLSINPQKKNRDNIVRGTDVLIQIFCLKTTRKMFVNTFICLSSLAAATMTTQLFLSCLKFVVSERAREQIFKINNNCILIIINNKKTSRHHVSSFRNRDLRSSKIY